MHRADCAVSRYIHLSYESPAPYLLIVSRNDMIVRIARSFAVTPEGLPCN